MVAVITGNGLGLERSSAWVLGSRGQVGQASVGQFQENVYVNAANGNLVINDQDEFLAGVGPDTVLSRTYNSQGLISSTNTWRPGTQRKIRDLTGTVNTVGSTITRSDWDSSTAVYTWDAAKSAYIHHDENGADDTLTLSGSTWTWTDGNSRMVETYDNSNGGRIVTSADIDGNTLTFTYGGSGLVSRVTNQLGEYIQVAAAQNVVETWAYPAGSGTLTKTTTIRYTFDGSNRLTSVSVDLTPSDNSVADGKQYLTTYTYDGSSQRIATLTQSDGTSLGFTYILVGSEYRVATFSETSATSVTRTTSFSYDTVNRVTTMTDAHGQATLLEYNSDGSLKTLTAPAAVVGATAQVQEFTYDGNGRLTSADLGPNNTIVYEYDANGNLTLERDEAGNTVTRTYGAKNELLSEVRYIVPDPDGAGGGQPSMDLLTRYVYDAENHLRYIISPEGRVTEQEYDAQGRMTSVLDYLADAYTAGGTPVEGTLDAWVSAISDKSQARRTDTTYDYRGNITSAISYGVLTSAGIGDVMATTEISRTDYIYDHKGQLSSRISTSLGSSEVFAYDGMGRLLSSTISDGATTATTTQYLNSGRTRVVTLANGLTQTSVYNLAGELISYTEAGTGVTTAVREYRYDAMGRLRVEVDENGVELFHFYDAVGRLVANIDGDGSVTEFGYDANDLLVSTVRYQNQLSSVDLASLADASHNPNSVTFASVRPSGDAGDQWGWNIYDDAQRLVETIDSAGAVTAFEYDGASRLVQTTRYANVISSGTVTGYKTTTPTGLILPTADADNDRVSRSFYDDDGLLIGVLDGEGFFTEYRYDGAGQRVESVGYTVALPPELLGDDFDAIATEAANLSWPRKYEYFIHDSRGLLRAQINGEGDLTRYHYDALGGLDQVIRGQKVDPWGLPNTGPNDAIVRLTLADLPGAGSEVLDTTTYTRNLFGQVLTETKTVAGGTEVTIYAYDSMRQLVSTTTAATTADARTTTARYDVMGRLTGTLSSAGSAALAALGGSPTQLQINGVYAQWGVTYAYDAADRMISKTEPDGSGSAGRKTVYYYDVDGALRYAINAAGETVEYRYDSLGQQTATVAYGTRIAALTVATLNGGSITGGLTSAMAAIADADLDAYTQTSFDARGLVSQTIGGEGQVIEHVYNAFGEESARTSQLTGATDAEQTWAYDKRGLVQSIIVDPSGLNLTTMFGYDAFGQLIQTTDANGIADFTAYDRAGRMIERIADSGYGWFVTRFDYDGRGNVVTMTDANGEATTYTYDEFNRTVTVAGPEGLGETTVYNAHGETIGHVQGGVTTTWTYEDNATGGKTTIVVDPSGLNLTTVYEYDKAGRKVRVSDGALSVMRVTDYIYDEADRLVETRLDPAGLNIRTAWIYDGRGNAIARTDGVGTAEERVNRFAYDGAGRLTYSVDGVGAVIGHTYDLAGRVTETRQFVSQIELNSLPALDTPLVESDISAVVWAEWNDRATSFAYDTAGRLRFTINPERFVTEQVYDAAGRVIRTIRYNDQITLGANDEAYIQNEVGDIDWWSDRVTRYAYDGADRLIFTIDAENYVTEYRYDAVGNATKSLRYAAAYTWGTDDPGYWGMEAWNDYFYLDAGNHVSRTLFDGANRAVYGIDAQGYVTENVYDADNRLIQQIRHADVYAVDDNTSAGGLATLIGAPALTAVITSYAYDAAGRLTTVTDAEGAVTKDTLDVLGQKIATVQAFGTSSARTTTRSFDAAGRMESETRADGELEEVTLTYGYDALGRVESSTDGRGRTTTYTYDAMDQLLTTTRPLSSGVDAVTTNEYNAFGNVVRITDPLSNSAYFYYDGIDRLWLQVDPEGYATFTSFNLEGQVSTVTRLGNKVTDTLSLNWSPTLDWDGQNNAAEFWYDRLGRLTFTFDGEGNSEEYSLDAFGNRTWMKNKAGGYTDYTYDKRGLMLSESLPMGSAGTSPGWGVINTFEYDAHGNRTQMVEAANRDEARTTTFEYDKLDRLVRESGAVVAIVGDNMASAGTAQITESLTYDLNGNVIGTIDKAGGKTLSWYDDLDRKTLQMNAAGTLTAWTYDLNGNVKTERVYYTAVTPASYTAGGSAPAPTGIYREKAFDYDYNNRRISDTIVDVYSGIYSGEYGGGAFGVTTGNVTTETVYDATGNIIQQIDARGVSDFTFYDKLGRKAAYVDRENFLTSYTLDAEGNVTREERFATRLSGTVTAASDPSMLRSSVTGNVADRITDFTYDGNGRRLTESRINVLSHTVNSVGALIVGATTSTIIYEYNGLGLVSKKTEATGEYTEYTYDYMGRLEVEVQTSGHADQTGANVSLRIERQYDGLNNLVEQYERDSTGYNGTVDRKTTYTYGADGRLATVTDGNFFTRTYGYDVAGRVKSETYARLKSNGWQVLNEGVGYQYDVMGRMTQQANATFNGSAWVFADTTQLAYTTHGELSAKGLNGLWQEHYDYDAAGRLWRATTGEGSTEVYMSDKNGATTLTYSSSGQNLATATYGDLYTWFGGWALNAPSVGVVATIDVLDNRGMSIETRSPNRQLTASSTVSIISSRAYNAFGEVRQEIAAHQVGALTTYVTDYSYNTLGRVIKKESPTVDATAENGAISAIRPTDEYFYDIAGRMVGVEDANDQRTTRHLLAYTGHGDDEALVTAEFHADGGVARTAYDVHNNARKLTNELGNIETREYDQVGRMISLTRPNRVSTGQGALAESYVYDGLGQRTQHWNSQLGGSYRELTDYDVQGRVVSTTDLGGIATTYSYTWNGAIATSGLGTFGGWTKATNYVHTYDSWEVLDYFGRVVDRQDQGGHNYNFTFNGAGLQTNQSNNVGQNLTYTYFNTGMQATIVDNGVSGVVTTTAYGYDAVGNRTNEKYSSLSGGVTKVFQDAVSTYDALNRTLTTTDSGNGGEWPISLTYEYDAVGNVRREAISYQHMTLPDRLTYTDILWYRYDLMNRVVVSAGRLAGERGSGTIEAQPRHGVEMTYDVAGQRTSATEYFTGSYYGPVWIDEIYIEELFVNSHELTNIIEWGKDPGGFYWATGIGPNGNYETGTSNGIDPYIVAPYYISDTLIPGHYMDGWTSYTYSQTDYYNYTEDGYLSKVELGSSSSTARLTTVEQVHDLMGRMTATREYQSGVAGPTYEKWVTFNASSNVTADQTWTWKTNGDMFMSINTYTYTERTGLGVFGGAYLGGVVTHILTLNYKNGDGSYPDSQVTTDYTWWDGALVYNYINDIDTSHSGNDNSVYTYDVNGHVTRVSVHEAQERTLYYLTDAAGQVMSRHDYAVAPGWPLGLFAGAMQAAFGSTFSISRPAELYYYFNGRRIGDIGNNGAPVSSQTYSTMIAERSVIPTGPAGIFKVGVGPTAFVDLDQNYVPINASSEGVAATTYVAHAGDTLSSIAQSVWGDASLWYMLASANGLSASDSLAEGMRISIPNKVTNARNTDDTFRPYNPNESLGDVIPTRPKVKKSIWKALAAAIITVVVAFAAPYLLLGPGASLLATAAVGAAASVVSQGINIALDLQEGFSWKQVAMAGLTAGVGAGLKNVEFLKDIAPADTFSGDLIRGMATSAISQGVGVAVGLQDKFDWAGVAASGVLSGVGGEVGRSMNGQFGTATLGQRMVNGVAGGMAGAIASAATRTMIDGNSFGDNLIASLPSAIGFTLGWSIDNKVKQQSAANDKAASQSVGPSASPIDAGLLMGGAFNRGGDFFKSSLNPADLNIDLSQLYASGASLAGSSGLSGAFASSGGMAPFAPVNSRPYIAGVNYLGQVDGRYRFGTNSAPEYEVMQSLTGEYSRNTVGTGSIEYDTSQSVNLRYEEQIVDGKIAIRYVDANDGSASDFHVPNVNEDFYWAAKDLNVRYRDDSGGFADQFIVSGTVGAIRSAGQALDGLMHPVLAAQAAVEGVANVVGTLASDGGAARMTRAMGQALAAEAHNMVTSVQNGQGGAYFGNLAGGVAMSTLISGGAGAGIKSGAGSALNALRPVKTGLEFAESGVWDLKPFVRGQQIEQALGHNLPGNFPTIDRFENGIATSIKSIDLDAASYLSNATLNRTLTGYVDKAAAFNGRTWAGRTIESDDILGRGLDLAIPHSGNAGQQIIIDQAVRYGLTRGVTVNPIVYR